MWDEWPCTFATLVCWTSCNPNNPGQELSLLLDNQEPLHDSLKMILPLLRYFWSKVLKLNDERTTSWIQMIERNCCRIFVAYFWILVKKYVFYFTCLMSQVKWHAVSIICSRVSLPIHLVTIIWKIYEWKSWNKYCVSHFNPISVLWLNRRVGTSLAPAFILLCKILTLLKKKIFKKKLLWTMKK